ncbi:MAG: uracil-DNA glycosylase [Candidatus Desulforudis sp.]|nr:uracil-DNA glycosylase [Desulforudis sp.]
MEFRSGQVSLSDLEGPRTLDELRAGMAECRECGLAAGRTYVVFGEGNPRARLMLIGEGPGAEEDRLGRPFVGPAGQLLDKILAAAGITRPEVYIANVVKCRPPGNRVPTREEAAACLPWLRKQFSLIAPPLVVILGSTALKNLIDPQASITAWRGQWIVRGRTRLMPTYHPAALLRDPSKKRDVWRDFQLVRDAYREIVPLGKE